MTQLTLTAQQTELLAESALPLQVVDARGKVAGRLVPALSPEQIAEFKRRAASPGPWFTGAQVQARLRALEQEWERTGGFDEKYVLEYLAKLDAADPGHWRDQSKS